MVCEPSLLSNWGQLVGWAKSLAAGHWQAGLPVTLTGGEDRDPDSKLTLKTELRVTASASGADSESATELTSGASAFTRLHGGRWNGQWQPQARPLADLSLRTDVRSQCTPGAAHLDSESEWTPNFRSRTP